MGSLLLYKSIKPTVPHPPKTYYHVGGSSRAMEFEQPEEDRQMDPSSQVVNEEAGRFLKDTGRRLSVFAV